MKARATAGLLIYRQAGGVLEILLGHYGGPFWANRDQGAWTVFKGRSNPGETPLVTAVREFEEETGWSAPPTPWLRLPQVKTSHQIMDIWAVEADFDPDALCPGMFSMEWPRHSGRTREFPEIDRVEWFSVSQAKAYVTAGQRALFDHLIRILDSPDKETPIH